MLDPANLTDMQLAHQARTRKKITKQSLFDKFNFKPDVLGEALEEPFSKDSTKANTKKANPPATDSRYVFRMHIFAHPNGAAQLLLPRMASLPRSPHRAHHPHQIPSKRPPPLKCILTRTRNFPTS